MTSSFLSPIPGRAANTATELHLLPNIARHHLASMRYGAPLAITMILNSMEYARKRGRLFYVEPLTLAGRE